MPKIGSNNLFFCIRPGFRMVSEGSKTHLFFEEGFRNGRIIRFKSGGLKLFQIGSDDLFFYIQRRPRGETPKIEPKYGPVFEGQKSL